MRMARCSLWLAITSMVGLWRTDGTAAGTTIVKDISTQPQQDVSSRRLTDPNGTLFFWADNGNRGEEL